MLSLTKKSDQPVAAPLWHANFRNFERLPDTKVVRTTFFVNTAAGAAAIALLLWLGYGEYRLYNLSEQIATAQREIDANSAKNNVALAQSKTFADESKKLTEAEAFLKTPIAVSEYIMLLAQTLPKEISIDFADLRLPADQKNQVFTLRGVVAGTRDQAAGSASSYVESLKNHPRIGAVFDPISLDKLTPDGATGFMSFEISLKVKTEAKK
jgi:cell division protein FtsB